MTGALERQPAGREKRPEREPAGPKRSAPKSPAPASRGLSFERFGNRALLSLLHSGFLQPKARASQPDDPGELEAAKPLEFPPAVEADSVTNRAVARGTGVAAWRLLNTGPKAPILHRLQRDYGNRASQQIVRRALQEEAAAKRDTSQVQLGSISTGAGETIEDSTRAPLEAHFQSDLSDVRIPTDSDAAVSAEKLDARAYTRGRDIYFARGKYAPSSHEGRRLLAHEVTHVVQQSSGRESSFAGKSTGAAKIGAPDDALETEAGRAAQEFMSGSSATDEKEKRKWREASSTPVRAIQKQQNPQTQSTTALDATAQSIIRGAGDSRRDAAARAVEAVWRIIHEYYSNKGANVDVVKYDNTEAGTGLATRPHPKSNPITGEIFVGDDFLMGVQRPASFAHRALQVGHELEHIDQFRDPKLGPGTAKKDEREFLAFYHEALAPAVPHTGRFQHGTRIAVIDMALGYYDCLATSPEQDKKDAAKTYAANKKELLDRRSAEIAETKQKGYQDVPAEAPPTGCRRQ